MSRIQHRFASILIPTALWVALIAAAAGVSPPPSTDSPSPAPQPRENASPLAGPTVAEQPDRAADESRTSLVERNFDGSILDLGPYPELVAFDLVGLTDAQRTRLDAVRTERTLILDRAIKDNYSLLVELGAADPNTRPFEFMSLLYRLSVGFKDYTDRGSLFEELRSDLDESQRRAVQVMLDEYWSAKIEQAMRAKGVGSRRFEATVQIRLETLGAAVADAFQSQVGMMEEDFRDFERRLRLTPEQSERIKVIGAASAVQQLQGQKPSPAAGLAAYGRIHDLLDPWQQIELRKVLVEQWFIAERAKRDAAKNPQIPPGQSSASPDPDTAVPTESMYSPSK